MLIRLASALFIIATAGTARAAVPFEVSAGSAQVALLDDLLRQLQAGSAPQAVAALDQMLSRRGGELLSDGHGGWLSTATWLHRLARRDRESLQRACRAQFDDEAAKALQALRKDRAATPEQFYLLARRYLLSGVAAAALVEAGDRAAAAGDAPAADCFYDLARQHGWEPDPDRAATWNICRALAGQASHPIDRSDGELAGKLAGYRGPAAFDAGWYGHSEAVGLARYFPAACDGILYFAGARHALAIRENGQVLWRWSSGQMSTRGSAIDRGSQRGRGANYTCAVFAGAAGAQVLVARAPRGPALDFCLRAFRAADGRLLWTSESRRELDRLSIAGSPVIAGRHVYAAAVDFTDAARLVLVALDLLDGRLLFKSTLGTLPDMGRRREDRSGWDEFWEQTEPCVSRDAVYLTPNVGTAFCVDRFDGQLRWARAYVRDERSPVERARSSSRARRPTDPNQLLRWRGTPAVCSGSVIIAPQDAAAAWGLDAATGKLLWTDDAPPGWCLVGASESAGIFAGTSVSALDATTGAIVWTYRPAARAVISGPPVIANGMAFVPTSDGQITGISLQTGKPALVKQRPAGIRQILGAPHARKVLDEAMMLAGFGTPPPGR